MNLFNKIVLKNFYKLILLFSILSCSEDEDISLNLNEYDLEVISYFKDIALGFEFGSASEVTRKWCSELKIFIGSNVSTELSKELNKIVNEIENLTTDNLSIQIVNDSSLSNYYIYFGSGEKYASIFPSQENYINSNWGLFSVWWTNNCIDRGHMYVDIFRANNTEQKHLLREEFTQSLGLAKDSNRYPFSIFQSSWTRTLTYTDLDKDLIRLLYHPKMKTGLDVISVDEKLREILLSEK
ncbi:MAG: hypothetical protein CMK44_08735 [Porticoccus sp.]|nr:hypothetical protein [Porticoccus sp.]|tara:strand:+ start:15 stop:734 length:720 start_codon:yes stop_codon:yes gene_type:complete